MTDYKVTRTGKRTYSHCEKHDLKLENKETGETVAEQTVSFSNWQLNDSDYEKRVKNWASTIVGSGDHRFDVSIP